MLSQFDAETIYLFPQLQIKILLHSKFIHIQCFLSNTQLIKIQFLLTRKKIKRSLSQEFFSHEKFFHNVSHIVGII